MAHRCSRYQQAGRVWSPSKSLEKLMHRIVMPLLPNTVLDTQNLFVICRWVSDHLPQSICVLPQSAQTWILFLANSRWWISLGQSCITVVSCLSWQSRYFSPASMYSWHSWVWRLITPALLLPRTRPLAPLSAAPDRGPLRGSADLRSNKRTRVARRRMTGEERRDAEASRESGRPRTTVVGRLVWRDTGGRSQLCVWREKQRWIFKGLQWPVHTRSLIARQQAGQKNCAFRGYLIAFDALKVDKTEIYVSADKGELNLSKILKVWKV